MVVWLAYATAVGAGLGLAALLAERGLLRLGRPVRWVWAGAMAATVALPAVAGLGRGSSAAAGDVLVVGDGVLLAAWVAVSVALLANVRLSAWTVRRNARSWRGGRMGARRVMVSTGFGPGVVGAARPRIVLPRWVLAGDRGLERLIVAHEIEHVRAGDPRLLLGGVLLVALVPWCVPLWWQLHRLRSALETDCDARVLAGTAAPRAYANALLEVAGRRSRSLMPVPALSPGPHELERRLRLITRGVERSGPAALGLLVAAVVVVLTLAAMPAPAPPALGLGAPAQNMEPARGATVILSVQPLADQLKKPPSPTR